MNQQLTQRDQSRGAVAALRQSAASADASEAATGDNRPLDWELLVRRCLGRIDLAERLLKSFESRFPAELAQIEECLGNGNPADLARLVHQVKGAAANVSAMDLYHLMSQLELAVRADQRDAARAYVAEAHHAWDRYLEFQCTSIHRSNN
jgi:HPt (histidine-containing phosphotransfer) domain-containing protein